MANLSVASIFGKAKGTGKSSKTTADVIRRRRNLETANKRLLAVAQTVLLSQLALPAFAQHAAMSPLPSSQPSSAGNAVGVPLHSSIATTPTHSAPTPSVVPTSVLSSLGSLVSNSGSLVIDFGKLGGQMNYGLNSLSNSGTIYLVSSDSHITNAVLSLNSLLNTGTITSVIPQGGLAGYSNLVPNLNVTINALQHVINAGTITSAAALNVNAGGAIYNAPISQNAVAPVMQAATNLSLVTGAGAITNSGLMQAVAGNINVATTAANITQDLVFNNQAGTLQALQGAINFRDPSYIGTGATSIIGAGDILAQTMNVNGGKGLVTVASNTLTPVLNVVGCDASINASTGALNIGTLDLSGDPIIYNANGDVRLSGDLSGEGSLSIVATGSILGSATIVRTGGEDTSSPATIVLHAYQDIILSGGSVIKAPGTIQLVAEQGSVIAPGSTIHSDSTSPRDFGSFLYIPYTISVFAHSSISVGTIDNPGGFLALRAGGNIAGTTFYPGANPGSTTIGHINIYNSKNTGPTGFVGQVWIDDLGGPVTVAHGIQANGASVDIQSSDAITIGGPGILNTATIDPVGANISLYSRGTFTGQIQNNCFGCTQGGQVIAQAVDFNITNGIKNNSSGGGGRVVITGTSAAELSVGQGGLEIFDNAQTDGGLVSVTNYGPLTYSGGIHTANQGNGATVYLTSQAGLATVNSPINVSSTAGVAGNIDIEGGGGAVINSNLTANGAGIYSGIIVGGSGDVVVNGNLSANGNTSAGSIIVTNYGTPTGTAIINGNLTTNSSGGVGGNVSLYASGASTVLVNPGSSISANGAAGGGTVTVKTSNGFVLNGQSISANGTGSSANGGTISLTDGGVVTPPTEGGPITVNSNISANAGGTGTGGYVTISTSGAGNAVTIGSPRISAQGGTVSGDGNSIIVNSPGALTITNSNLTASARSGGSGNGGRISLTAQAKMQIFGGSIEAVGRGSGGNGGSVQISSAESSDLNVSSSGDISANNSASGDLGTITFTSPNSIVVNTSGKLTGRVNAVGADVSLTATADNENLKLGNLSATRGSVAVTASGNNANIELLSGYGIFGAGSQVEKAGNITLTAGRNLNIDSGSTLNANGATGQSGGSISLIAGKSQPGVLTNNGDISANGSGDLDGGTILLTQSSTSEMKLAGSITADAPGSGSSGHVNIRSSNAFLPLNVLINGKISADSLSGTVASINIDHTGDTNVHITGTGQLASKTNFSGLNIFVEAMEGTQGPAQLRVGTASAPQGKVTLITNGDSSSIVLNPSGKITADGKVDIEAGKIRVSPSSTISSNSLVLLNTNELINTGTISCSAAGTADSPIIIVEGRAQGLKVSGDGGIFLATTTGTNVVTFANHITNSLVEFSGNQTFKATNVEIGGNELGVQNNVNFILDPGKKIDVVTGSLTVFGGNITIGNNANVTTDSSNGDITLISENLTNFGTISSQRNIDLVGGNSGILARVARHLTISGNGSYNASNSVFIEGSPHGTDPLQLIDLEIDSWNLGGLALPSNVSITASLCSVTAEKVVINKSPIPFSNNTFIVQNGSLKFTGVRSIANDGLITVPGGLLSLDNQNDQVHSHSRIEVTGTGALEAQSITLKSSASIQVSQEHISGTLLGILAQDRLGASVSVTNGDLEIAGLNVVAQGDLNLTTLNGNIVVDAGTAVQAQRGVLLLAPGTVSIGNDAKIVADRGATIFLGSSMVPVSSAVTPFNITLQGIAQVGKNVFFAGNIGASVPNSTIRLLNPGLVVLNATQSIELGASSSIIITHDPFVPVAQNSSQSLEMLYEDSLAIFSLYDHVASSKEFREGEWILVARKTTSIKVGCLSIFLNKGSIILAQESGGRLAVFNLFDSRAGAVKIECKKVGLLNLPVGHVFRTMSVPFELAPERRSRTIAKSTYKTAEYSLLGLFGSTDVVRQFMHSCDKRLKESVLKTAAAASTLWSNHGNYTKP